MAIVLVNRAVCAVLALVAIVAGLVVAAEILAAGVDRGPWLVPYDRWDRWARATSWSDGDIRLGSVAVLLVGAGILLVQFARRRPDALALTSGVGDVAARVDRRGAERWLAERAGEVDGVTAARARIGRKVATVQAGTLERDTVAVARRLEDVLQGRLSQLGLERPLRVKADASARAGAGSHP